MTKNRPSPHQHHSVVNRNAVLREARARDALLGQPTISSHAGRDYVANDLGGRMKVVADRDFKIVVEHHFGEGKFSFEDAPNPINQLGAIHEQCVPLVTSNDYASFMAAFNKRSNFMQAGTGDDIDDIAFQEALDIISEIPDNLFDTWDDNDHDRTRWLDKFDPAKRRRMEDAYEHIPFASPSYIGRKDLSVKQECLIKRDDAEWAPRVIYAGNDVFNTVTGPASMVVMERLIHLSRVLKQPIGDVDVMYAYKTNDVALCEFLLADPDQKDTVEGDFSRNDREQRSRVALIYDAWLGKLGMPQWFRTLLLDLEHYQVQNMRFGFKAKLAYQLATGTTSTTPRNSTYNATMFAVAVRREAAKHPFKLRPGKRPARAIILGDDILAKMVRRFDLDDWVKTVADFKMVLKAKAPRINGEATLLSRRLFTEVDVPCMVPLLGKMLVRFNIRSTINDAVSDSAYMAGKALSYAYECRHVPLLSRIFLERYEMEHDRKQVQLQDLTWFTKTSGLDIDQIVRAIRDERVLISDVEFGMWTCEQYALDFCEVQDMFRDTVLNPTLTVLDTPLLDLMACDL